MISIEVLRWSKYIAKSRGEGERRDENTMKDEDEKNRTGDSPTRAEAMMTFPFRLQLPR